MASSERNYVHGARIMLTDNFTDKFNGYISIWRIAATKISGTPRVMIFYYNS